MKIATSEGILSFNRDAVIVNESGDKLFTIRMEQSQGTCVLSVKTSGDSRTGNKVLADNILVRPKCDNVIHVIRPVHNHNG